MQEAAAKQLNNYVRLLPCLRTFFHLPLGQATVLGEVFSFTGDGLTCRRTYKTFQERAGVARATVGRALRAAREDNLATLDKEKGYVFNLEKVQGGFLRLPGWVISEEFQVRKNERRKLLISERTVFSKIFTLCDNAKKDKKSCEISISELAAAVGLSERTVQRALWVLIRAGLIYRPHNDRGVNAFKKSCYTLNYKLIRTHDKVAKKERQAFAKEPTVPPQSLQPSSGSQEWIARVERYYYDKRAFAELRAERNLIRARQNEKFKAADDACKSLGIAAAFAQFKEPERVAEYERRAARAKGERLAALKELGLTEQDLEPQYECRLCNDTGYRIDTGQRCKCFPPGGSV